MGGQASTCAEAPLAHGAQHLLWPLPFLVGACSLLHSTQPQELAPIKALPLCQEVSKCICALTCLILTTSVCRRLLCILSPLSRSRSRAPVTCCGTLIRARRCSRPSCHTQVQRQDPAWPCRPLCTGCWCLFGKKPLLPELLSRGCGPAGGWLLCLPAALWEELLFNGSLSAVAAWSAVRRPVCPRRLTSASSESLCPHACAAAWPRAASSTFICTAHRSGSGRLSPVLFGAQHGELVATGATPSRGSDDTRGM